MEPDGEQRVTECGYYLRHHHHLIRRHEEVVELNTDNTARWSLRVDFELPDDDEAHWSEDDGDKEKVFLFPLLFLSKTEARLNIAVREEDGATVQLPVRSECDEISALAAAQSMYTLAQELPSDQRLMLDVDEWKGLLLEIPKSRAFPASMTLRNFRLLLGLGEDADDLGEGVRALGRKFEKSGLDDVLEMLVEHSLIWVTLRGRPNERRSIVVSQEIAVSRRALFRWSFGRLKAPRFPKLQRRKARRAAGEERGAVLEVGEGKLYGRRDRRFSFSALGERIAQPLAWMPYEFELPTIYTKRCASYHFEVRCPPGRMTRDIRLSQGPPLAEPAGKRSRPEVVKGTRKTLSQRIARFDIPESALTDVARFRITVGIGDGAFPALWFFVSAITAAMLWIFAAASPELQGEGAQIATAILLIVPALAAGLAINSNEVPITQLLGGARALLLITGLSAVVATTPLLGAEPFEVPAQWTWLGCAMLATAASVPLATAWLLSSPLAWRRLIELNNCRRQEAAMAVGCLATLALAYILSQLDKAMIARGAIAAALLVLTIVLSAVANDRAAMEMGESRRYVAVSLLLVALTCLTLACLELCAVAASEVSRLQVRAEEGTWIAIIVAFVAGDAVSGLTSLADPREDEVHVSPRVGRSMLAEEKVREVTVLIERERLAVEKDAAGRSTVQSSGTR